VSVADITGGGGYPGSFTSLAYTTTLTGGTGVVAIGTNQIYKNASGDVGLGTSSPLGRLDVAGTSPTLNIRDNQQKTWVINDIVGTLDFYTDDASSVGPRAVSRIRSFCDVNSASPSGALAFWTAIAGSTATEKMRITSAGDVIVTGAGGLGYGTGSGGTVTQGTSRTTGVTLNKTNGGITLFTAAGSIIATTFTVTNSTVAATDTIILSQKSGTNLYMLFVTAVAAGSFNITFFTTGGIASDAPVINFAVIKAVTA
jgi:hypothetical protein